MAEGDVIIVLLRRPRNRLDRRDDPFWEFGSFGCTRCHSRNLLNQRNAGRIRGRRLAFAQGGEKGFRLVFVTPKISVVSHKETLEARWQPWEMPMKYAAAPLLIDNDSTSDFDFLPELLRGTDRTTPVGRFSSKFRSRVMSLNERDSLSLVATYEAARRSKPQEIAVRYEEALPGKLIERNNDRKGTYEWWLSKNTKRHKKACISSRKR